MESRESVCYWKELWRLTSDSKNPSYHAIVTKKLNAVQNQLENGLRFFAPASPDSYTKLADIHKEYPKILTFIEKLQQFMDLNSFQTWDVFCNFLLSQYHGTVENALKNFSFVDVSMNELLLNVWSFYNSERLFMLKQLRLIFEFKGNADHAYNKEFDKIIRDIKIENLKKSLIKQFEFLVEETPPNKSKNGDIVTLEMQKLWIERNLREQVEILLLLLCVIHENTLFIQEFKQLFSIFKIHNFGRQPMYFRHLDENNKNSVMKIIYAEVAIFYKIVSDAKGSTVSNIIQSIKDDVENELIRLQHNEEHGALLLAWMLLLLEDSIADEIFISKYQHFGTKALQLRVFEFLFNMFKHPMFSGDLKCGTIFRNSVYNLLCNVCNRFDGDGSISMHPFVIELSGELLNDDVLAKMFWNSMNDSSNPGVVSLWNTALEYFPFDFKTLSIFIISLSKASNQSFSTLMNELNDLPLYTEKYKPRSVTLCSVMNNEDNVILTENYHPYDDEEFVIQSRTQASIMDRRGCALIHFRVKVSYWKILHNELNRLIDCCLRGSHDISVEIDKAVWGIKALHSVLINLNGNESLLESLITPCETVFDILVKFSSLKTPHNSLIAACLDVSVALLPRFYDKIFGRLMSIGFLPYLDYTNLTYTQYSNGESFHSSLIGLYLINVELPLGEYKIFSSYLDLISAFCDCNYNNDMAMGVLLPGLIFILREVFPNMSEWYFVTIEEKRKIYYKCVLYIFKILQLSPEQTRNPINHLLNKVCLNSLLDLENATALLKLISLGENKIQSQMENETNWISGHEFENIKIIQMSMSALMQLLRLKHLVWEKSTFTPLEHLIYTQPKQKGTLKIIPIVTSYMNHVFNKNLPNAACKLLTRFALESRMSLLVCLDMSPHQIRIMFLERLRDESVSAVLKTAILEFVASCVEHQPGLTEVFFKVSHPEDESRMFLKCSESEQTDGILTYMAEYLSAVKSDTNSLYNPLLSRIMNLFHVLWKNNMQMLVKDLRKNPDFWEYLCSPLFQEILPHIKAYSQIFNIMGIELFIFEGKVDKSLQSALEKLFNPNNDYLKKWIEYIFSFNGRDIDNESSDIVPSWLSLLTSWKDFVSIIMKHFPFPINTKNKITMVSLCLDVLNKELESGNDNRTIIILSEMYVIYFSNWKDDCFGDKQDYVMQIANLLNNTASSFENLHYRAKHSILSICTLSMNILDYDLKSDIDLSQKVIKAVCLINNHLLVKLETHCYETTSSDSKNGKNIELNTGVIALKLLEQCLYILKNEILWDSYFTSRNLIAKLVYFITNFIQKPNMFAQTLAALNVLIAFARSKLSKELLYCDIGQNLWLKFLPPKSLSRPVLEQSDNIWQVNNWWHIYRSGIELVTAILEKQGNFFSLDAITFAGVQEEFLTESILLIHQTLDMDALNLTHSALYFISQLIKYEFKWKHEHYQSLLNIMRSITICLHHTVTLILRPRGIHLTIEHPSSLPLTEESDNATPSPKVIAILNKLLEIMHLSSGCLRSFSPNLLNLLADPCFEISQWQPLMELQFGAPKLTSDPFPQLTFGTILSAVCFLTRSLNYNFHAEDIPLNSIRKHGGKRSSARRRISGSSSFEDNVRRRSLRSDSVTSVSSTTSTTINPNCLAALDKKLVLITLENILTLLASQTLLATKDPTMSSRDKQLVRRELCAELPIFHEFVKKKVIDMSLSSKNYLSRRKHGIYPLLSNEDESKHLSRLRSDDTDEESDNENSLLTPPPPPPKRSQDSMRISVVRKLHLDKTKSTGESIVSKPRESAPMISKSSISSTPSSSRSTKHVTWDDSLSMQEGTDLLDPEEPECCSLSEVQMVEEDYLHFLSNIFLYICQTDH